MYRTHEVATPQDPGHQGVVICGCLRYQGFATPGYQWVANPRCPGHQDTGKLFFCLHRCLLKLQAIAIAFKVTINQKTVWNFYFFTNTFDKYLKNNFLISLFMLRLPVSRSCLTEKKTSKILCNSPFKLKWPDERKCFIKHPQMM